MSSDTSTLRSSTRRSHARALASPGPAPSTPRRSCAPTGTLAIDVLCDASVVLKWFHDEDEADVADARRLLSAHRSGLLTAWILELTFLEIGNVLLRALGWTARDVAEQLDDLRLLCAVLPVGAAELRLAAQLGEEHRLSLYDATYAAVSQLRSAMLATADKALLGCGAGESSSAVAARAGV